MILRRLDKLEAAMESLKDTTAQVSKVSTQTYSNVVELHPRAGQIAQNTEKLKSFLGDLLESLRSDAHAEQQQG